MKLESRDRPACVGADRLPSGGRRLRAAFVSAPFAVLLTLTLLVSSALPGSAEPTQEHHFISRPDLSPPMVRIDTPAQGTEPGYVFLDPYGPGAQNGPMIIANNGQPIWSQPITGKPGRFSTDAKVQQYKGKPVLTWWQGQPRVGFGVGEHVIMDQSYRRIGTVRAGNGMSTDMHELTLTDRGTAYVTSYNEVPADRLIREGVVQEIDIASGDVLFEWHSLDHIAPDESTLAPPAEKTIPYDYFHLNSITEDADGDLTISARHTDAVYQIDRSTGDVEWRLGGKRSDFAIDPDAGFARQHNARWQPGGTLSLFDNHSGSPGPASRALVLNVDEQARTASLVRDLADPAGKTSVSQGNHQILPGGHSFVGWGSQPNFTEFAANGDVLFHGSFGDKRMSYRAYRFPWKGTPAEPPAAVQRDDADGVPTLYMSWNGSTELRSWRVLAGSSPNQLTKVTTVPKTGFETATTLPRAEMYAVAEALDAQGNVIGRSRLATAELKAAG